MKMSLLSLCLFSAMSASAMTINPMVEAHQNRKCGDDLLCYFSANEIRVALGEQNVWPEEVMQTKRDPFEDEADDRNESTDAVIELVRGGGDQSAPIWSSFISNFRSCAQGCVPANYGTYGTRGRPSCHNTGRAVDVGAIVCGGSTHKAINGGRFAQFVACMRSKMKTLYRNGSHVTQGHHDHAHFSNGCVVAGGRNYY